MGPAQRRLLMFFLAAAATSAPAQDPAPAIVRGPYLQAVLSTSGEVIWRTDIAMAGRVRCEGDGGFVLVVDEDRPDVFHRVKLNGFSPGNRYRYRVFHGDVPLTAEASFRTAPDAAGTFRAVVVGDSGTGLSDQENIATLMGLLKPDLILHTGDLDYVKDVDRSIFHPYRDNLTQASFFPVLGNHDLHLIWNTLFFPPGVDPQKSGTYYSYDWGSAHFVVLDTETLDDPQNEQLAWLAADLEQARLRPNPLPWTILYMHKTVYTVGPYHSYLDIRAILTPTIDRFKIDLVLTGHDHNYQRTHPVRNGVVVDAWQSPKFVSPRGTIYVITGGGGQLLYLEQKAADHRFTRLFRPFHHTVELTVAPQFILVRALSPQVGELDVFSIQKEGPRPEFRLLRGDTDGDGQLAVTDAVSILEYLFRAQHLDCPVAADVDGSGDPEITDSIYLLFYLFMGGPPPAAPFPSCGPPADDDDSWCARASCEL